MQGNDDRSERNEPGGRAGIDPPRTDRAMSGEESDVAAAVDTSEEPMIIGPDKARAATTNRMPARVLLISVTLTALALLIGYLLVR